MNFNELKGLVTLVSESAIKEFKYKDDQVDIRIRTDKDTHAPIVSAAAPMAAPMVAAPAVAPVAAAAPVASSAPAASDSEDSTAGLLEVKSPMVGTFYRSPSPDKPVYKNVGDSVAEGDVVCIVEAMKLFNEIESEVSGKIVKVMVDDASPVEYDQVLFLVDPNA